MRPFVALFLSCCACGVPIEQLEARSLEAENYKRQYQDESQKRAAQDAKLKELEAKVAGLTTSAATAEKARADLETALSQTDAEKRGLEKKIEELNALNSELAQSKEKLAQAKEALEKRSSEYESLAKSLKDEIQTGKIELSELKGRMVVKMKDKILFSSGGVKLNKEGVTALEKVASALKEVKGKIIHVEGHTDNVPVDPKGEFSSNWELSTARALVVVHLLADQGVPPGVISAVGDGEYHPIANNATPAGRSLNRRIEIVLAPGEQAAGASAGAKGKK